MCSERALRALIESMFASTWLLLLATTATAVFSKQIGSLVKWVDCNVVVVDVVIVDTLDAF